MVQSYVAWIHYFIRTPAAKTGTNFERLNCILKKNYYTSSKVVYMNKSLFIHDFFSLSKSHAA